MSMPSTLDDLQKILVERDLYPWHAAADGSVPPDGYALIKEGDKWCVFYHDRGLQKDLRYFATEHEAVRNLIEQMKNDAFARYLEDL